MDAALQRSLYMLADVFNETGHHFTTMTYAYPGDIHVAWIVGMPSQGNRMVRPDLNMFEADILAKSFGESGMRVLRVASDVKEPAEIVMSHLSERAPYLGLGRQLLTGSPMWWAGIVQPLHVSIMPPREKLIGALKMRMPAYR